MDQLDDGVDVLSTPFFFIDMMPKRIPERRYAGFTLVELLVVMVIIGIMSAVVLPRVTGSSGSLTQKTASRKVCASLRFARSQAVSKGRTMVALVDREKGQLIISSGSDLENGDAGAEESNGRMRYALPEGTSFEKTETNQGGWTGNVLKIIFYPIGRSSGGQFHLNYGNRPPFVVSVDRITGAVSLGN